MKAQSSIEWLLSCIFLLACVSLASAHFSAIAGAAAGVFSSAASLQELGAYSYIVHSGMFVSGSQTTLPRAVLARGNCLYFPGAQGCQVMARQMHVDSNGVKYGMDQKEPI